MSNIKLTPNALGTGNFSIASPNSNTDRTLTLPDQTGTLVSTDASGNLGLGVTPSAWSTNDTALQIRNGAGIAVSATPNLSLFRNSYESATGWRYYANGFAGLFNIESDGAFKFFTTPSGTAGNAISFTQAMTLDASGNLLVGTTSYYFSIASRATIASTANQDKLVIANYGDSFGFGISFCPAVNSATPARFLNAGGGQVGSISTSASATTYNTSSDYRLKHDIQPMTGALARVAALKPVTYKWNVDGSDGEGFIAHELAEVVPQCVTGEKDAVDAEGNPVYQGIDTSFLAGLYAAAIQELTVKLEAAEARIAALEAPSNGVVTA